MTFTIITILFVILGGIYLYRRKSNKPGLAGILQKGAEVKPTIDEAYNLNRSKKEAQLNTLLDKINRKGYDSLSEKEKQLLKELSQ